MVVRIFFTLVVPIPGNCSSTGIDTFRYLHILHGPHVIAALRTALADPSDGVRRAALQSLSGLESEPVVVEQAARLLADPVAGVRIDAAQLLKNLGPVAKPAIPALIAAPSAIGTMMFSASPHKPSVESDPMRGMPSLP